MTFRSRPQTILLVLGALGCLSLLGCGSDAPANPGMQLTTRAQTVRPVAVPSNAEHINPSDVAQYATYGYSAWQFGPGEDRGRKFDLMPAGYRGAPNAGQLTSFFTISDAHITDKESPAQLPYFGWVAPYRTAGPVSQAYSPVMLYTTHVLDAAVRTINALHSQKPLEFGLMLGDAANNSQYNELRWFIDVMDGGWIEPSSGDHRGADTIDYQQPYQAVGLDPSIPWYTCLGNHDENWMGVNYPTQKLRDGMVSDQVLNIGSNLLATDNAEATGVYVGVVDGTTEYGVVTSGGAEADFPTPPTVAADDRRHCIASPASRIGEWVDMFFTSPSLPRGHGLDPSRTGNTQACYSFRPNANVPLKVIVLDDTCKSTAAPGDLAYNGSGWIDEERLSWLTGELQQGQNAGELMIIACHIPINPQADLDDTSKQPQFHPDSYRSDAELIDVLRNYPNLILLLAGHRHINAVTPHPSTDPAHPENSFWEVETASLRDFPQQFRIFDIRRNSDNTVSIIATNVDPQVEPNSPAARSRGYAVGAHRLFNQGPLSDTSSHTYNAELVKQLTPAMQEKIALFAGAAGH